MQERGSMAVAIAAFGWLLFGALFSGAMCFGALELRAVSMMCVAGSALTLLFPVVAVVLGVVDLLRGRAAGLRALSIAGTHLVIVGFLGGIVALIVATSR